MSRKSTGFSKQPGRMRVTLALPFFRRRKSVHRQGKSSFSSGFDGLEERIQLSATAFELNDVGYFFNAAAGRIERFDIEAEAWLSPVTLEGAPGTPSVIYGDSDGLYAAYGRA